MQTDGCAHLPCARVARAQVPELVKVEGIAFGTKDRKGSTCLALAAIGGHADVVKLLASCPPLSAPRPLPVTPHASLCPLPVSHVRARAHTRTHRHNKTRSC
jgi:hypothetical protein